VWAADVTYIPMACGFLYLVAIIDWASRAVLAWRLSNTNDASARRRWRRRCFGSESRG
jgi:putative transposase